MSKFKKPLALTIFTEEEDKESNKEPLDINSIVEHYFRLHDNIEYSYPRGNNLGSLYRHIYTSLNTEDLKTEDKDVKDDKFVFDNTHIELGDMRSISRKSVNSKHKPIFYEFTEQFHLPPIRVHLSENNKFIVKTFTLDGHTPEIKIEQLMLVIREIVMQLYGYYLNSIRPLIPQERGDRDSRSENLVIIPKIYYVQRKKNSISVCMEYIPPAMDRSLTFDFDPIIKSVFGWFKQHNLHHNDTAPRNIFLSHDHKLAVIDFGEAYIKLRDMPDTHKIEAQKTGYLDKQDKDTFKYWIKKIEGDDPLGDRFGGNKSIKRKKPIKKKTKRRRGKKSKKINTRRKK
jgi:hypothetical protein